MLDTLEEEGKREEIRQNSALGNTRHSVNSLNSSLEFRAILQRRQVTRHWGSRVRFALTENLLKRVLEKTQRQTAVAGYNP